MSDGKATFAKAVLTRDRVCQNCGSTELLQAHHIKHRADGGSDDLSNGITLCASCHADEHPNVPRKLFFVKKAFGPTIQPRCFKLTPEARVLLTRLSMRSGISRAAVLELLIREKAMQAGIEVTQEERRQWANGMLSPSLRPS